MTRRVACDHRRAAEIICEREHAFFARPGGKARYIAAWKIRDAGSRQSVAGVNSYSTSTSPGQSGAARTPSSAMTPGGLYLLTCVRARSDGKTAWQNALPPRGTASRGVERGFWRQEVDRRAEQRDDEL